MSVDVAGIAGTVSAVDEEIEKLLPTISMIAGLVPVPGASVVGAMLNNPLVMEILQKLDEAAKAVAAGNPGAAGSVILGEVMNHLDPTKAFVSPILSGGAPMSSNAMSP